MIKGRQKFVLSSVLFLSKNAGIKLMETLIITEKVTVLADGDQVVFKIKTSGGYYKYVRRNVADIKRIIPLGDDVMVVFNDGRERRATDL